MNPEWIVAGVAVLSFAGHLLLSQRDRGRTEQSVADLKDEMLRERSAVGECQLAEHCELQMRQMGDRVNNAHKRMDRQDERIDRHDDVIRELGESVAALRGSKV